VGKTATMSLPGNLRYCSANQLSNNYPDKTTPIRLSFHFKPAIIDEVVNTRNKNKLYRCLQPISPKKNTPFNLRPRTLGGFRRGSSSEIMNIISPRTKSKINLFKKSETSTYINGDVFALTESAGNEQKHGSVYKKINTFKYGKRLKICCGVAIEPDLFLSIVNSHGGIEIIRKNRLWSAVKRDLKIKHPNTTSSNHLSRIYDDYENRGMFDNVVTEVIEIDDDISIISDTNSDRSKEHSWSSLPMSSLSAPISSSLSIQSTTSSDSNISSNFDDTRKKAKVVRTVNAIASVTTSTTTGSNNNHNNVISPPNVTIPKTAAYTFAIHELDEYNIMKSNAIGSFFITNSKDMNCNKIIFDHVKCTLTTTFVPIELNGVETVTVLKRQICIQFSPQIFEVVTHLHQSMVMFLDAVELGGDLLMKKHPNIMKELSLPLQVSSVFAASNNRNNYLSNTSSSTHYNYQNIPYKKNKCKQKTKNSNNTSSNMKKQEKVEDSSSSNDDSSSDSSTDEESNGEDDDEKEDSVRSKRSTSSSSSSSSSTDTISIAKSSPKKPREEKKDAVDFYSLYHKDMLSKYIVNSFQQKGKLGRSKLKKNLRTVEESVCFWCKDGGSVITCDCTPNFDKTKNKKLRCSKVYHDICLGFKVPEEEEAWNCPRHFCKLCADYAKYLCISCPTSFCKKHVFEDGKKSFFTPVQVNAWDQKEKYTGKRKYVICNCCANNECEGLKRGLIKRPLPRDHEYKLVEEKDEDEVMSTENPKLSSLSQKVNMKESSFDDLIGKEFKFLQKRKFDKKSNRDLINAIHVVPLGLTKSGVMKIKRKKQGGYWLLAVQVNHYGEVEGGRFKVRPSSLIPLDKNIRRYATSSLKRILCKEFADEKEVIRERKRRRTKF
jgi:hypothetical protein